MNTKLLTKVESEYIKVKQQMQNEYELWIPTCVENPMNRPLGDNILVVPNEVHLLPNIAEEPIHVALTQVVSTIEPIWAKNTHLKLWSSALFVGVQCVKEGSPIVPFKVMENLTTQLVLYDVEISTIDPVVP